MPSTWPSKYGPDNILYFAKWIRSLQFVDQMVMVTKRRVEQTRQQRNCLAGSVAAIAPFAPQMFEAMRCFQEPLLL